MNNCCGSLALYWQNVVLRAVRGAGKDNPLAEIVACMRLCRAFPRTSLKMSCCLLAPDCGVVFLVESGAVQLQEMREKVEAHPKPWVAAALDTSRSSQCQGDKTTSPFLQILCHHSWRGQPVPPAPPEPTWQSQGSTTRILSPLIFPVQSLIPVVTIRNPSFVAGVYEGKSICVVTFSQVFIFNPLWGAVVRIQARRLLIYLQLRLSESGC